MKTVIVTGAAGNLGQAVVEKFIGEGYRVVGTVTHKRNSTVKFPEDKFIEAEVDVADEGAAKSFVDDTISKYGDIAVAVLTVGGFAQGTIAKSTSSDLLKQYNLNFVTAYNVAQPLFNKMVEQNGGRIFFIGSRPGIDAKSSKGMVGYGLAKSMLFRVAELMNDEGAKHNVTTSVIVPSTIDTPANRESMPGADFSSWVTPRAIADVIYFYTTQAADSIKEPVIKVYNKA